MKGLLFIISLFAYGFGIAQQDVSEYKKKIDSLVNKISKEKTVQGTFRWKLGSYEYQINNKKIVRIVHKYNAGPLNKIDTYFFKDSALIYAEEKELSYYFGNWSGQFYFKNGILVDILTLGHGKSETDEWNPEKDVLRKYNDALKRVNEYLKKDRKTGWVAANLQLNSEQNDEE